MRKLTIFIVTLCLLGCTSLDKKWIVKDEPEDKRDIAMHSLVLEAESLRELGDVRVSITKYQECLTIKPGLKSLETSQPRRWCQNNLINIMLSCNFEPECNKADALQLAVDLIGNNPKKNMDVAYSGTYAKALYGDGKKLDAINELKRVIGFMSVDHPWRKSYISLLAAWENR